MSHLVGEINITYDELVDIFGPPNGKGDDYKVDAEWELNINGREIYIYNYKDGRNYLGKAGLDVKDITDWHIGGDSESDYKFVLGEIETFREK